LKLDDVFITIEVMVGASAVATNAAVTAYGLRVDGNEVA